MIEGKSDRFCINCKLVHETEKAWLITADGTNRYWVPKSQGEMYAREDKTFDLFAPEWLLKEKGLI